MLLYVIFVDIMMCKWTARKRLQNCHVHEYLMVTCINKSNKNMCCYTYKTFWKDHAMAKILVQKDR